MSFETEKEAKTFGDKILTKLKGEGWKVETWENLGWHVRWFLGRLCLYYSRNCGTFSTLISDCDQLPGSGSPVWSRTHSDKDPNAVVRDDLKFAMDLVYDMKAGLTDIKCALNGEPILEEAEEFRGIHLDQAAVCSGCDLVFEIPEDNDFATIPNLNERLDPGDEVPVAECPSCSALAHVLLPRLI